MNNTARVGRIRRIAPWAVVTALIAGGTVAAVVFTGRGADARLPEMPPEPGEATSEQVHQLCAGCHAYPPPDTFPKSAWRKEVTQGYDFFHADPTYRSPVPHLEGVVRYYTNRAPEALEQTLRPAAAGECPARFQSAGLGWADKFAPGLAHVDLVHLTSKTRFDLLACDAVNKRVLVMDPTAATPVWRTIAEGLCCAHAEVADLDGDGINDVIVAVLGNFYATDERTGRVVWLRGAADGSFTPATLLDGLGRVADVRVADFTGDGKPDLVVAEFGWHRAGGIILLENVSADRSKPAFTPRVLDNRHGTTHVPVADLNGDGKPDFVAVISQEHETVVAFLNEGGGKFKKEVIFAAPHPSYGCNGVTIADLDGDGKPDVILSNGDSLDAPYLLRPDHGVTWLKNEGKFPFTATRLADSYGAGSPTVADFDGDGLLDMAFASFLPQEYFPQRVGMNLESVVLLRQSPRGTFSRYVLETARCDHLSCVAGDLDGDGRPDLVVGNYVRGGRPGEQVTAWRNGTAKKAGR